MKIIKNCLHNWHSVYYGSDWEVECSKCDKSIWDVHKKEKAISIINRLTKKDSIKESKADFTELEIEMFEYLNVLRESGVTNMFGASPYLEEEFDINRNQAKKVLVKWMENFNEGGYTNLDIKHD